MKAIKTLWLLCLLLAYPLAGAADQVVQLYDGSTINGKVVSLSDGVYTIESATLGRLQVEAAQVRGISASGGGGGSANQINTGELLSLQQRMMGDPGLMGRITALQNDPQVKAVLEDPEIIRAVQSMDFQTLSQNPKFLQLLQNSRVQEIQAEMLGR